MDLPEKELKTACERIKKEIGQETHATIIVHHNADPDAIGSAIALARGLSQLKLRSTVLAPADISRQSMALLSKYPYPIEKDAKPGHFVFIIDSSSPEQIPVEIPEKSTVVLLDHHEVGALAKRADVALIEPESRSTASIVLSVLRCLGVELTKEIRFFIVSGIIADTGFLRHATRGNLKAVLELTEDIELEAVFSALAVPEELSERIAKLQSAKRLELYRAGDFLVAYSNIGSFESQAALSLIKGGADIAVVFNIKKSEIRISGRMRQSMPQKIDLAQAFMKISTVINGGAGGHRTAASANGKDTKSMDAAKNVLNSYFESAFEKKLKRFI